MASVCSAVFMRFARMLLGINGIIVTKEPLAYGDIHA